MNKKLSLLLLFFVTANVTALDIPKIKDYIPSKETLQKTTKEFSKGMLVNIGLDLLFTSIDKPYSLEGKLNSIVYEFTGYNYNFQDGIYKSQYKSTDPTINYAGFIAAGIVNTGAFDKLLNRLPWFGKYLAGDQNNQTKQIIRGQVAAILAKEIYKSIK